MPDIYDPERGLKIGLTDEDYENYQNGNLSDDFYAGSQIVNSHVLEDASDTASTISMC